MPLSRLAAARETTMPVIDPLSRSVVRATIAALAALIINTAPASAQSGFVGNVNDPVTGWRCVTPFCDTIRMPRTDCLCQKLNPTEKSLSRLRLKCVPPRRDPQNACALPRGFGG